LRGAWARERSRLHHGLLSGFLIRFLNLLYGCSPEIGFSASGSGELAAAQYGVEEESEATE